jgi:hypothetical protein
MCAKISILYHMHNFVYEVGFLYSKYEGYLERNLHLFWATNVGAVEGEGGGLRHVM